MNINDFIGFAGIMNRPDITEEMRPVVQEIVGRLETFRKMLIREINAHPSIIYGNPNEDASLASGTKPGDIIVWRDGGVDYFRVIT